MRGIVFCRWVQTLLYGLIALGKSLCPKAPWGFGFESHIFIHFIIWYATHICSTFIHWYIHLQTYFCYDIKDLVQINCFVVLLSIIQTRPHPVYQNICHNFIWLISKMILRWIYDGDNDFASAPPCIWVSSLFKSFALELVPCWLHSYIPTLPVYVGYDWLMMVES